MIDQQEEAARVPWIMRFPGRIPAAATNEHCLVATGLDLLATCCDYAGVTPPPHCRGLSLRAAAEAGPAAPPTRRQVYAENGGEWGRSEMLVTEDWKLVQYSGGLNAEQLYDLRSDPGETRNHAEVAGNGVVLGRLRAALDAERATHAALVL
jgi:choline-sulfatase